jgi:hypothetical protein
MGGDNELNEIGKKYSEALRDFFEKEGKKYS